MFELDSNDFVGKTIQKVDFEACNVARFWFSNGTYTEIWAESDFSGISFMGKYEDLEISQRKDEI